AHLHRPAWAQGSVPRPPWNRAVEAAAVLGLGRPRADAGAAPVRGLRRGASPRAEGTAGRHAGARGPSGPGGGLFPVPAHPGGARSRRLGGYRYLSALVTLVG